MIINKKRNNPPELIKKYGIHPQRKLGQNFLLDKKILREIIRASEIKKGEQVIEIGPGSGILTRALLENGAKVAAIEFDKKMIEILKDRFKTELNLDLIAGDALDELTKIEYKNYKIIANLPYQITSPFFKKALDQKNLPKMIVVMVQKEMAERIVALPHNSKRGFLSVLVQFYGQPEIVRIVSKDCFYPKPKVESAIIKILVKKPKFKIKKEKLLKIIQAGFSQKRKKIRNSIAATFRLEPKKTEIIIRSAKINPSLRAEDLDNGQWLNLAEKFSSYLN